MKFVADVQADFSVRGVDSLEIKMPFDEKLLLEQHILFVCRDLGVSAQVKEYVEEPVLESSTVSPPKGKEKTDAKSKDKPKTQQQQQPQRPDKAPLPGKPVPFFF